MVKKAFATVTAIALLGVVVVPASAMAFGVTELTAPTEAPVRMVGNHLTIEAPNHYGECGWLEMNGEVLDRGGHPEEGREHAMILIDSFSAKTGLNGSKKCDTPIYQMSFELTAENLPWTMRFDDDENIYFEGDAPRLNFSEYYEDTKISDCQLEATSGFSGEFTSGATLIVPFDGYFKNLNSYGDGCAMSAEGQASLNFPLYFREDDPNEAEILAYVFSF